MSVDALFVLAIDIDPALDQYIQGIALVMFMKNRIGRQKMYTVGKS